MGRGVSTASPRAEETAYCLLALAAAAGRQEVERPMLAAARRDWTTCAAAPPWMTAQKSRFPPLWIDKCLYTPTLVVSAVIDGARYACASPEPQALAKRKA